MRARPSPPPCPPSSSREPGLGPACASPSRARGHGAGRRLQGGRHGPGHGEGRDPVQIDQGRLVAAGHLLPSRLRAAVAVHRRGRASAGRGLPQRHRRRARQHSQEWGIYQSWGRLAAASGWIGVTFDSSGAFTETGRDIAELFRFLRAHGSPLGIRTDRLAAWVCSGNVHVGPQGPHGRCRSGSAAAVVYYGASDAARIRGDLPVFLVKAGRDNPRLNAAIDALVGRAAAASAPWTVVSAPELPPRLRRAGRDRREPPHRPRHAGLLPRAPVSRAPRAAAPVRSSGPPSPARRALAHWFAHEYAEAATAYGGVRPDASRRRDRLDAPGHLAGARRKAKDAEASLAKAVSLGADTAIDHYNVACGYAVMGQPEKALDWLERAVEARLHDKNLLKGDDDLTSLHGSERFENWSRAFIKTRRTRWCPAPPSDKLTAVCPHARGSRRLSPSRRSRFQCSRSPTPNPRLRRAPRSTVPARTFRSSTAAPDDAREVRPGRRAGRLEGERGPGSFDGRRERGDTARRARRGRSLDPHLPARARDRDSRHRRKRRAPQAAQGRREPRGHLGALADRRARHRRDRGGRAAELRECGIGLRIRSRIRRAEPRTWGIPSTGLTEATAGTAPGAVSGAAMPAARSSARIVRVFRSVRCRTTGWGRARQCA